VFGDRAGAGVADADPADVDVHQERILSYGRRDLYRVAALEEVVEVVRWEGPCEERSGSDMWQ